jgi:hypothetical protein
MAGILRADSVGGRNEKAFDRSGPAERTTLAACGNPYPRSDLAYLDRGTGTYVVDRSPYNGQYWDRYYYGPRYY